MSVSITAGKVAGVFLLGFAVLAISSGLAQFLSVTSTDGPNAAVWVMPMLTHLFMLSLSLVCILIISKGRVSRFGLTFSCPVGVFKALGLSLGIGLLASVMLFVLNLDFDLLKGYTLLAIILLVWGLASVCEEVFCRGLLQSMFAIALGQDTRSRPLRPGAPIVLAALFFALMHLPLIMLGVSTGALVILLLTAFLLGWIAGYVRERTGSVAPAILVHAVFNVSGSLTDWWARSL